MHIYVILKRLTIKEQGKIYIDATKAANNGNNDDRNVQLLKINDEEECSKLS